MEGSGRGLIKRNIMEGMRKTTNLTQDSRYPSRDLNHVPPELNVMITSDFLKDYSLTRLTKN
jgi:hypothetical protein